MQNRTYINIEKFEANDYLIRVYFINDDVMMELYLIDEDTAKLILGSLLAEPVYSLDFLEGLGFEKQL